MSTPAKGQAKADLTFQVGRRVNHHRSLVIPLLRKSASDKTAKQSGKVLTARRNDNVHPRKSNLAHMNDISVVLLVVLFSPIAIQWLAVIAVASVLWIVFIRNANLRTIVAGLLLALLLPGCASSHVLVGTKRPAIAPEQVRLYLKRPVKYEEVALLDANSNNCFKFSQQGKMDAVINRLKHEAARLGANGILLQSRGDQLAGFANTGIGSTTIHPGGNYATGITSSFSTGLFIKSASGLAIYVPEQ